MQQIVQPNLLSNYGEKLSQSFDSFGQLCVGIDPHASLLTAWGLEDSAHGLREFSLRVVEASAGKISAVKPQVSFFERFGAAGYQVLQEVTVLAHSLGLLVIADAKRGDIGTTMDAYLDAWFADKSGLFADALTVSPYLGLGSVTDGFGKWAMAGKGIYSLVATSNPQGETVQMASINGRSLAADQWDRLSKQNGEQFGPCGSVLGATLDLKKFGINLDINNVPILAPGFGAQGARLADARSIFGPLSKNVSFSVSRSVLESGPNGLVDAIQYANLELKAGLNK